MGEDKREELAYIHSQFDAEVSSTAWRLLMSKSLLVLCSPHL